MSDLNPIRRNDALLIIDVQNDFFNGGALPVKGAESIVPAINTWIDRARRRKIPVYASRDWHPRGHVSFAQQGGNWPPHCIQGTPGAEFHPGLELPDDTVVITKGVRFDRDQESVFEESGLAEHLQREEIRRLLVCGLALDVCVQASVMDAVGSGFEVLLITEGTRAAAGEEAPRVVARLQKAGVALTDPAIFRPATVSPGESAGELDFCVKAPEWAEHQRLRDTDIACDDGRRGNI